MIYVDNRQDKFVVDEKLINKLQDVINLALKEEKVTLECEISLLFVDNEEIKEINRENRGIDRETDVLSFPMLDYPKNKVYKDVYVDYRFDTTFFDGEELVLGDVVLSLEKVEEQRIEYNHSFEREACYLVVHSVLHLLGYDHMEDHEKNVMRAREEHILSLLNIKREQ